ncbi:MAG: hypothetical protein LBU34_02930, partial [Planctomycetaceae bacterium]|nr:hypothetical protein [Planctomycetaceae bacterium]
NNSPGRDYPEYKETARDRSTKDTMRGGHVREQRDVNSATKGLTKEQKKKFEIELKKLKGTGNQTVPYEALCDMAKDIKINFPNL